MKQYETNDKELDPSREKMPARPWVFAILVSSAVAFLGGALTAFGVESAIGTTAAKTVAVNSDDETPLGQRVGGWLGLTEAAPGKGPLAAIKLRPSVSPRSHSTDREPKDEPVLPDGPAIAIIIDDLGLNAVHTQAVLELPNEITLAFLPYGRGVAAQARMAHNAGHETMLHMPMEPAGHADPGPGALRRRLNVDEFDRRLRSSLEVFDGFVGLNNHMGSKLTADRYAMDHVMKLLKGSELIFVDSRTTVSSVAHDFAKKHGLRAAKRDVFLDHNSGSIADVTRALRAAEAAARKNGLALAIGHPRPATIDAIRRWVDEADERGIALVSITDYVAREERRDRRKSIAIAQK